MDLTEMMGLLMLDLKMTLDTDISTAEATRCINRAVDDLSRHIPREKIYEHTWVEAVTDDSFTTPTATDVDYIVDAMDISASVDGAVATLTATLWLDVPRPIKVTLTDANNSITRMTLIVKGIDLDGVYREERFYRHDGKVQTGKVYFSQIYEVEINEIAGNGAADVLDVGTDEPDLATGGVWSELDYPVEPDTITIYSAALKAGTKYTLDTDYQVDYATGRVRLINGGAMAANTTYYANYDKHNLMLDISSILPELTRIVKVVYPADKVPEQQVAYTIWHNTLTMGSQRPGESQKQLVDEEHIAIYYETRHTPPTFVGSGSYPGYLDQVVLIGAGGYALLIEALQYELQAVTDLASLRTALTNATKYLDNNSAADAAGILQDITDNVAELRTKLYVAWDATNSYLDEVDTTDLALATDGAEALTAAGRLLINQLNDGKDVPEIYADYARARAQIGQVRAQAGLGYLQEAESRLSDIRTYIDQAGGYSRIGEAFIAESSRYREAVENDMLLADRFRVEAQNRLGEFRELLRSRAEYRKRIVDVSVRQPA